MKSKLPLLFLLIALSFGGLVNKAVGAVPAYLSSNTGGQGQALPLQNNWSRGFLFVGLNPDGVNATRPQHKKRPKRKSKHKAKVYTREAPPDEAGAPPPPPSEAPPIAAPAEASPGIDASGRGRSSPPKKGAPKIKPPTVMIKPPTE